MIEECGVPYEYKRVDVRARHCKTPELTLGESIAITFYLAETHAPALLPSDLQPLLTFLDRALEGREYLVGDTLRSPTWTRARC